MFSLLETTCSLAIAAILLASILAAMQQAVRIEAQARDLCGRLFAVRQFETLIDRAAAAAGSGPTRPAALRDLASDRAVFRADLNGDGNVSDSGSESTAIEIVNDASRVRLRHRLGYQTMTVLEFERASADITAYDRFGASTLAPTASLLEVNVEPGSAPAPLAGNGSQSLHLLFAIPEATRR